MGSPARGSRGSSAGWMPWHYHFKTRRLRIGMMKPHGRGRPCPLSLRPLLPSRHAPADALECTAGSGKLILGKEAPVSRRHRWMKRISPPRWWRWWVLRMANEERWRIRPRRDGIVACESVRMGGLEGGGVRQEWERSRRSRRNAGSSRRPTSDIRKAPTGRHTPGARQYAADSSVL